MRCKVEDIRLAVLSVVGASDRGNPFIRISPLEDGIEVDCSGREMAASARCRAEMNGSPLTKAVAPPSALAELIRHFDGEEFINLSATDDSLILQTEDDRMELPLAVEPPEPRRVKGDSGSATTDCATLWRALRYATPCIPSDSSRYAKKGVLVDLRSEGESRIVATDGRRCAVVPLKSTVDSDIRCVASAEWVNAAAKIAGTFKDLAPAMISADSAGCQVSINGGESVLFGQLLEDDFPAYEAIVPKVDGDGVKVDRKEMLTALRKQGVIAAGADEFRIVVLHFDPQRMGVEVRATGEARGRGTSFVPATGISAALEVAFSPDYLIDVFRVATDVEVEMHVRDEQSPALFRLDCDGACHVVMPIHQG